MKGTKCETAGKTIPVVLASNTSKITHIFFDVIHYVTAQVIIHQDPGFYTIEQVFAAENSYS